MKSKQLITILLTSFLLQACLETTSTKSGADYPMATAGPPLQNTCANNVQQQFATAKEGLSWETYEWSFDWTQAYEPNGTKPTAFMNNYLVKHVQGFVRTNSSKYPFVGSHSNSGQGGIFVIQQKFDGKLELVTLHLSASAHPSGVHAIGKFLVYGDSGGKLIFKDINSFNQNDDVSIDYGRAFGGGLGFAKREDGSYLAITTGPGGDNKSTTRYNYFSTFSMSDSGPSDLQFENKSEVSIPSNWSSDYKLSENLSVITECGTGDIYTIHSTGEVKKVLGKLAPFGNDSYWRLSKLESNSNGMTLKAINFMQNKQSLSSCNPRATGTVAVSVDNKLEFYCHQHSQSRGGATSDKYLFEVGTLP